MDLKKVKVWTIRSVIPLIGLALSLYQVYNVYYSRCFSYEITSKTELKSIKSENWPDIGLWYKNKVIEDGGLLSLRLVNSGNKPIYANEFDGPVTIRLKADSLFIAVKVLETTPKNLSPTISMSGNMLRLEPLLLNPDDAILIQTIVRGDLSEIDVRARIGGIKAITDLNAPRKTLRTIVMWACLAYGFLSLMAYSLVAPFAYSGSKRNEDTPYISKFGGFLVTLVVILPGYGAFFAYKYISGTEIGLVTILYFVGLFVLANILAFPFSRKRNIKENKTET